MDRRDAPPPYATVVFDCDSTLSFIEGIEFLAAHHGDPHKTEISELTQRAMDGQVPLEAVFGARLDLVQPSADALDQVGRAYIDQAVPHGAELVAALTALNKRVLILSGGLLPAVAHLARALGIPAEDAHAVDVVFDAEGRYVDFDRDSPLAHAGGKPELLRELAAQQAIPLPLALVGDGATDLEAAPACARFIAFGGVARREGVFAGADACCEVPDLAALVPLLFSPDEYELLAALPAHRPLLDALSACCP